MLVELERLGVLTMASNYRVGQRGRLWACWYRFGSGELSSTVSVPAATWEEIAPFTPAPLVPTLAVAPTQPAEPPSASRVELCVLGERLVPEGLVRVLSDGARGVARTLLVRAPDVDQPTAKPAARAPWFERAWLLRPFTPGRLWSTDPALVIAFPDVEARRRMTRRERLAWGGGGAPGPSGATAPATEPRPLAPVIPLPVRSAPETVPSSPIAPAVAPGRDGPGRSEALRAELAELAAEVGGEAAAVPAHLTKVGDVAAALPDDLLEVLCRAWGGFKRQTRGP